MKPCIECGGYIREGYAEYNNVAAKIFIPFAGGLIADGPFCSKGCKRDYLAAKEAKSDGKALKKEAKFLGMDSTNGYGSDDLKEQRLIMEMRKEEREAEELRERREKEAEETRQRQAKAAVLRTAGHPTRAFLLHYQNALLGAGAAYLFAAFFAAITLSKHKGEMAGWVWAVAGVLAVGLGVWVVRRIVKEKVASKLA